MSKDSQIDTLEKIMLAADKYIALLEENPETVNISDLRNAREEYRRLRQRRTIRIAAWETRRSKE